MLAVAVYVKIMEQNSSVWVCWKTDSKPVMLFFPLGSRGFFFFSYVIFLYANLWTWYFISLTNIGQVELNKVFFP